MNYVSAVVALAAMATLITLVWLGGPWALLGVGLIVLAGAAIYARQPVVVSAPRRRRRRRNATKKGVPTNDTQN